MTANMKDPQCVLKVLPGENEARGSRDKEASGDRGRRNRGLSSRSFGFRVAQAVVGPRLKRKAK